MAAGVSYGPTPWWQLPEYNRAGTALRTGTNTLGNLQRSAPSGYEYDPVKMSYVRTPASAGERLSQFRTAAMGGSLDALRSAAFGGGGYNSGGGGGGGVLPSGAGIAPGSRIATIAPVDMTASNAATFGKAKDVAGQIGRSSLDSLRAALGETGQLGGGAEVQGARDVIESAAGNIGDVNRALATQNAQSALETARLNYQGGITQRGQDIAAQEAQARLAQEQAQLEFQRMQARSQQQLDWLKLILGGGGGGFPGLY